MKKCPYCAEEIQDDAVKCKHCHEMLDGATETRRTEHRALTAAKERTIGGEPSTAWQPEAASGGGLDFRTLSKFLAVLGAAVACYGGFRISQNLPLPEPPPGDGQFKGWSDFLNKTTDPTKNAAGVALINIDRARVRTDGYKVLGLGALVVFVGLAVERSAKGPR